MNWLVYQMYVEKEDFSIETRTKNIAMGVIVRNVQADSKAEAIGRFIIGTSDVKCSKRVGSPDCFELDKLITI